MDPLVSKHDSVEIKEESKSESKPKPVVYICSQELAQISSLLPANKGRSMMVHSLVRASGLMSPSPSSSSSSSYSSSSSASPSSSVPAHSTLSSSSSTAKGKHRGDRRSLLVVKPHKASAKDLLVYHTKEYVDFVLLPFSSEGEGKEGGQEEEREMEEKSASFGLEDDCPRFPHLPSYVLLVAGATLTACMTLRRSISDIAICWDGGRHHAKKDRASGFCYVADCVLGMLALTRTIPSTPSSSSIGIGPSLTPPPPLPRAMYIDLDLHFSDGVSEAFYNPHRTRDSNILTLSIHHTSPGFFPPNPLALLPDLHSILSSSYTSSSSYSESTPFDPYTLSIPLQPGASAKTYAHLFSSPSPSPSSPSSSSSYSPSNTTTTTTTTPSLIQSIIQTFSPDYIMVQCGVDGLAGDPCGVFNWGLSNPTRSSSSRSSRESRRARAGNDSKVEWDSEGEVKEGEEEQDEDEEQEQEKGSFGWCISQILQWAREDNRKVLLLGGGGYNSPNAARAWTYITSLAMNVPLNLEDPIPDHAAFPAYAPGFTYEAPPGNMADRNSDAYMNEIDKTYREGVLPILQKLCSSRSSI